MGITVKNLPKDIDNFEPDGGDVIVDRDGEVWLVTENATVVCLNDGAVLDIDDISMAKVYSNCTLTLG